MDPQIIAAIITGLCTILSVVIACLLNKFLKKRPTKRPPKVPPWPPILIAGVIGGLLGFFVISPFSASFFPKVTIISPLPGISIPREVTVHGTASNIPNGKDLWLFVVPEGVMRYYPQPGPLIISPEGSWSASAGVGLDDPVDIGRGFLLIVALADQQGSRAIRNYLAGPDFPGLESLPEGVKSMAQVRVIRR